MAGVTDTGTLVVVGFFDTVHAGWRCGQVKCLGRNLSDVRLGDRVEFVESSRLPEYVLEPHERPVPDPAATLQVEMAEGGWLQLRDGVFVAWTNEAAEGVRRVDRFGWAWTPGRGTPYLDSGHVHCGICAEVRRRGAAPDRGA